MIEKIVKLFQKPTETDANGNVLQHENYKVERPVEAKHKYFAYPIARNVIEQSIANKYDFIEFVNEYKTPATKIFYNDQSIRAVFNYSTAEQADHGDSYAKMVLEKTRDFKEFENAIDAQLAQKQFIGLIKRLEPYITAFDDKPVDDMDIIEVAENLQASKNINSVQRNTAQTFVIDAEIRSGNSSFEIPRFITFKMPVFQNDIMLTSELKTELFITADDSGFEVTLACYKLEQSVEDTLRELTRQVQNGCNGISSYMA